MLRVFGRVASLAIILALATGLVGCSQYGKLKAKQAFKDANVLYAQQEYKRAAALYEEAITQDPELSVAYFYLGNSYDNLFKPSRKGEPENDGYLTKAIEYYTKASEKEQDPTLRKRSFEFLVAAYGPDKMNDPGQQEPIVNRMIQLDPQDATNYFALAKIREDAGDYVKAEEVLLQAKQARPNDPQVYLQLAGFYNRQEEFEKTIDALNQRAAIEPNNPEAFYTISTYYWDKAYRDFRLKEPEKKEFVLKGIAAGRQGASAQARLHGGADLQEPPAAAPGQPREGHGEAVRPPQGSRQAARPGARPPEEAGRGHQVAAPWRHDRQPGRPAIRQGGPSSVRVPQRRGRPFSRRSAGPGPVPGLSRQRGQVSCCCRFACGEAGVSAGDAGAADSRLIGWLREGARVGVLKDCRSAGG